MEGGEMNLAEGIKQLGEQYRRLLEGFEAKLDEARKERDAARAEVAILREELKKVAAYGDPFHPLGTHHPGYCPYGCDTPTIAAEALAKTGGAQ